MEASALYSQAPGYTQEDDCLYLALGMAHASLQLFGRLEEQAEPKGDDTLRAEPDEAQLLLLGMVSFFRSYLGALGQHDAIPTAEELTPQAVEPEALSMPPGSLLR